MDIFGSALLDHASGLRDHPITIRRDDDFVDEHSPGLYFEAEPFAHEAAALEHVRGPVLDIGCGAGRHLQWLAARGIEAAGIDASPGAIETCRQRGCPAVTQLEVMTTDLPANTRFETALLFGNNIGIGGTFEGAQHLLSKIAAAMSKTGRLLLTSLDVARTQNPIHLAYHQRNLSKGRPKGEITMRFEYR
ncbi:MAG: class I SAM-dependent methyltransferase, partial [Pseudomonadota bacterium]